MRKKTKLLLIYLSIVLGLFLFLFYPLLLLTDALFDSYHAYKADCGFIEINENTASAVTFINATTNKTEVIYFINKTEDLELFKRVEKHELCHVKQYAENRTPNCDFPFGVYLNELECNIKENF